MKQEDILRYNKKTASYLGWSPDWFGGDDWNLDLIEKIKAFQKKQKIEADGMVGNTTYRRIYTDRISRLDASEGIEKGNHLTTHNKKFLIYGGNPIPIDWPKVKLWTDDPRFASKTGTHRKLIGRPPRKIKTLVTHHSASLCASNTIKILNGRRLSSHLIIDNDGTIILTTDLQNICFHAGHGRINAESIGVEIENAYYPKYNKWYTRQGLPEREIIRGLRVHGKKLPASTALYPIQIEAVKALIKCLNKAFDIPIRSPRFRSVHLDALHKTYPGILQHFHISRKKIDCISLDLQKIIEELKSENNG